MGGFKMTCTDYDTLIHRNPVGILQSLIRFDTTNPPGNEVDCIKYIDTLLKTVGFETIILEADTNRPNLVARLKGEGSSSPLLMYGHVDVVSTKNQSWRYDPFEGKISDGYVWGRGTLDMKGAVAMMLSAIIRYKLEGFVPGSDIVLCIVSDEENGGKFGAKYLAENHSDLFKNIEHAIGEIGGFTLHMGNKRFYPISIAEKQICSLKTTIKGPGGHGSLPITGGAMAKLGEMLKKLDSKRLPVHITPPTKMMIEALVKNMSFPTGLVLRQLLNPVLTDKMLNLLGDKGKFFDPILHNTINATMVNGGTKVNVIPGEIAVEFDGRILPGYSSDQFINELNNILGRSVEFEITSNISGPQDVNMGLFDTLSQILREGDTEAIPIPFVLSGVTDARYFSKLGIQTYGFTPMILPKDIDFSSLIHGANERIPIEGLEFGANAIYELIKRYR